MSLTVRGIPTESFEAIRRGGPDAYGQRALIRKAEGPANPCRHCLELIRPGDEKLVLAYRPFPDDQPYAETGPIFLHRSPCTRYASDALPGWFAFLDPAVVRGYDASDWIRYETGRVVEGRSVQTACEDILADGAIRYVHVRSRYGCFQCRVERS